MYEAFVLDEFENINGGIPDMVMSEDLIYFETSHLKLLKSPHLESLNKPWENLTREEQCGLILAHYVFGLTILESYPLPTGGSLMLKFNGGNFVPNRKYRLEVVILEKFKGSP